MTFTERAVIIRSSHSAPLAGRGWQGTADVESGRGGIELANTGARVGERLRAIRRQKGLSLHDVEARSSLEFKASVFGAYERGERAISVPRLLRLAEIYEVPADQLLPRDLDGEISLVETGALHGVDGNAKFTIDLVRLHELDDPDAHILDRFATSLQRERQDFNGRMLTIRRSDLRVLASCMGRSLEELGSRLEQLGLPRPSPPADRSLRRRSSGRLVVPGRPRLDYLARTLAVRTPSAPHRVAPRPEATARAVRAPVRPDASVKILVPGNHLMVGLLGQRDELLRLVEAAFPVQILVRGNEINITGDARRGRARRPALRGARRAARAGPRARPREPRSLDRDDEGRPTPDRGAHAPRSCAAARRSGRRRRARSATSTRCATTR